LSPASTFEPSALEQDRRAYRHSRARRSTAIALISTLVFATAAYLTVTNAPGWERTKATFFDVSYGWEVLPTVLSSLSRSR
jgi:polar amino acid transport system permease protein